MSGSGGQGSYERQHRGGAAAYEAYFAGMDASVQQKVALTTAHFPARGRVADMGCGSGRGTYDLACLYHGLELVGVDINPVSVRMAGDAYKRPNLSFVVGDISEKVFDEETLDGVLNSSVLHHVTSFNDFDLGRVMRTLDKQVAQLKTGGVIVIRDFVIPEGPEEVLLDLPTGDGKNEGEVKELSTAALFERFARDWRSSVNKNEGVPFGRLPSTREGFARFRLAPRAAAEFVLRKDYRADWDAELLEEYTYMTQRQFEEAFRVRGLRVVTSAPIWNPWIVRNRFEGRFHLSDLNGNTLPFPPTNYLIVGEKVRAGAGVELVEKSRRGLTRPGFLGLTRHKHKETGQVFELVERPNLTVDLVPWFEDGGQVFVYAKKDFPRPVVNACAEQPRPGRASFSGYITEPLSAIVEASEDREEAARRILAERAGFAREDVVEVGAALRYFTSPGGVNELVESRLVCVRPRVDGSTPFPNYTSFRDAGTVRELDAVQVLRACHVGGMFDARLEINVYRLLRELGRRPGPWIGGAIELEEQHSSLDGAHATSSLKTTSAEDAYAPARREAFERLDSDEPTEFLSLFEGSFVERDRRGQTLSEVPFEYVVPRSLSLNTLVAIPVARTRDGVFVGVEHRDLPAAQSFNGNSALAVAPAWRLPRTLTHRSELPSFLSEAMRRDFGARVRKSWELGGAYFATPGVTPETVYPYAAEIELHDASAPTLTFVRIEEAVANLRLIQDAHLLITLCRLAHALGAAA